MCAEIYRQSTCITLLHVCHVEYIKISKYLSMSNQSDMHIIALRFAGCCSDLYTRQQQLAALGGELHKDPCTQQCITCGCNRGSWSIQTLCTCNEKKESPGSLLLLVLALHLFLYHMQLLTKSCCFSCQYVGLLLQSLHALQSLSQLQAGRTAVVDFLTNKAVRCSLHFFWEASARCFC